MMQRETVIITSMGKPLFNGNCGVHEGLRFLVEMQDITQSEDLYFSVLRGKTWLWESGNLEQYLNEALAKLEQQHEESGHEFVWERKTEEDRTFLLQYMLTQLAEEGFRLPERPDRNKTLFSYLEKRNLTYRQFANALCTPLSHVQKRAEGSVPISDTDWDLAQRILGFKEMVAVDGKFMIADTSGSIRIGVVNMKEPGSEANSKECKEELPYHIHIIGENDDCLLMSSSPLTREGTDVLHAASQAALYEEYGFPYLSLKQNESVTAYCKEEEGPLYVQLISGELYVFEGYIPVLEPVYSRS